MRRFFVGCLVSVSFLLAWRVSAAKPLPDVQPFVPYQDEFVSAVVMTPKTHQLLYAFKPDLPHPAASLSKLPNALAFLTRGVSMSRSVSLLKQDEVGGGRLRVSSGSTMKVQDMFYSSITASANNTAMALARLSGLKSNSFLKLMNQQAVLAGAKHSVFFDFAGMDPRNITTARDMALIADRAFADPTIRRAASTASYSFTVRSGRTRIAKTIKNTNDLLTKDPDMWVIGGKTGYLEEAKNNLVVRLRKLDERGKPVVGTDIVVVVFGASTKQTMFAAAKRLAQWTWNTHAF